VEAVARKLVGRDIIPEVAGLGARDQQVSDHAAELLLRPRNLLVSMEECRQLGVVVAPRRPDQGEVIPQEVRARCELSNT
jgi:hypothetical protein